MDKHGPAQNNQAGREHIRQYGGEQAAEAFDSLQQIAQDGGRTWVVGRNDRPVTDWRSALLRQLGFSLVGKKSGGAEAGFRLETDNALWWEEPVERLQKMAAGMRLREDPEHARLLAILRHREGGR